MISKKIKAICCLFVIWMLVGGCQRNEKIEVNNDSETGRGFSKKDLALMINKEEFRTNNDVKTLLNFLGEDYEYAEAMSCEYDGMDKTFMYPGVNIYTYPKGNDDYILEILLTDESYSTSKGVKVGMAKEDVINTYGENYFISGINMVYNESGDSSDINSEQLYFILDGEHIEYIGILAESKH